MQSLVHQHAVPKLGIGEGLFRYNFVDHVHAVGSGMLMAEGWGIDLLCGFAAIMEAAKEDNAVLVHKHAVPRPGAGPALARQLLP